VNASSFWGVAAVEVGVHAWRQGSTGPSLVVQLHRLVSRCTLFGHRVHDHKRRSAWICSKLPPISPKTFAIYRLQVVASPGAAIVGCIESTPPKEQTLLGSRLRNNFLAIRKAETLARGEVGLEKSTSIEQASEGQESSPLCSSPSCGDSWKFSSIATRRLKNGGVR